MQRPHVSFSIEDHIARIVLDRPPVNALNQALVASLTSIANELRRSSSVWVVTLTSSCEVFCAGADLKERAGLPDSRVAAAVGRIRNMVMAWYDLPQPVLAGIDGPALGGGLELALAADVLVTSGSAILGFPETSLGIIPGAGGTLLLAYRAGQGTARKWIFTSRKFSADEAFDDGVVDVVLPAEDFTGGFARFVAEVRANAPLALRQAKKALRAGAGAAVRRGIAIERGCYAPLVRTRDRKEALQAFLERRDPRWIGK